MHAVTGATGQLGRLVIEELLKTVPPGEIVAAVRDPAKAEAFAAKGVVVRQADYNRPETLRSAFAGVDKLLFVSSNELGGRAAQHQAVIDAAEAAGVGLVAYTSILHADRSSLKLADDHRQTEAALRSSGLPAVLLRNGWYTENYLMALHSALEHGAMAGAARMGRISLAARADYAAAAAAVLLLSDQAGRTYELAGDDGWTLADLAGEVTRQSGKTVAYHDLSQADYEAMLAGAGLPPLLCSLLADADAKAAGGALLDDERALSRLIGRPTTPVAQTVTTALRG